MFMERAQCMIVCVTVSVENHFLSVAELTFVVRHLSKHRKFLAALIDLWRFNVRGVSSPINFFDRRPDDPEKNLPVDSGLVLRVMEGEQVKSPIYFFHL